MTDSAVTETSSLTGGLSTYNQTSSISPFPSWQLYIESFALLVEFAVVPGNILTVIACIKFKELRSPAHLLIINQSIGDLVFAAMSINISFPRWLTRNLSYGKCYCLFSLAGAFLASLMSVLNLMAISIDRFLAVVFTFEYYTWVTSLRVNVAVCLVWTFVVFSHLIPVMGWNTWREGVPCLSTFVLPTKFFNAFFIFPLLVSLLITAIGNVIIAIIALKKSRKIGDIEDQSKANLTRTQLKVTKMLLMVVGTFYICWMPYIILTSLLRAPPATWKVNGVLQIPESARFAFMLSPVIAISSAFFNPLIYAYKNKDFRRAYYKLLGTFRATNGQQSFAN